MVYLKRRLINGIYQELLGGFIQGVIIRRFTLSIGGFTISVIT